MSEKDLMISLIRSEQYNSILRKEVDDCYKLITDLEERNKLLLKQLNLTSDKESIFVGSLSR